MRRIIILVSAAILFIAFCGIASAEPSIWGPTGLLNIPTADIATPESAWISGNYIDYSSDALDDTIWTYCLLGGISENMELGIAGYYHSDADDGFGINAKYALLLEDDEMPGVSLGFNYMDSGDQITQVYLVASRYFQTDDLSLEDAVGIHGGIGWLDSDLYEDDYSYWGGIDFNLDEQILGIAEYVSVYGPEDNDALSFGVRYLANEQWSAQAGWIDGDLHLGAAFIF